jgi:hypothetical protein
MSDTSGRPNGGYLVDCPYCEGEGTDTKASCGLCPRCYGTGRMTWFLAQRIRARWAAKAVGDLYAARPPRDRVPEDATPRDAVPDGWSRYRR